MLGLRRTQAIIKCRFRFISIDKIKVVSFATFFLARKCHFQFCLNTPNQPLHFEIIHFALHERASINKYLRTDIENTHRREIGDWEKWKSHETLAAIESERIIEFLTFFCLLMTFLDSIIGQRMHKHTQKLLFRRCLGFYGRRNCFLTLYARLIYGGCLSCLLGINFSLVSEGRL